MAKSSAILAALLLVGCGSAPEVTTNVSTRPSYDRSDTVKPTSGIVRIWRNDKGEPIGRIITPHFHDRYNALIDLYGDQFTPVLKRDEGVEPICEDLPDGSHGAYTIRREYFIKMGQMQQWRNDGRKPSGTIKRLINKIL